MRSQLWVANRLLATPSALVDLGARVQAGHGRQPRRIRKHRGGHRDVVIAGPELLHVLKKALTLLYESDLPVSPAAYGFVPKRSIVDHARLHLAQPVLAHLDVQDFFGSVTREHVAAVLSQAFASDAVQMLLDLTTLDGHLPQGFPTSPHLSNLVFYEADLRIAELAADAGLAYSRYADDITISGEDVDAASTAVAEVLSANGWVLNESKTRVQKRGQRQYVTGLTVFDSERPRLSRRLKRRYRLKLHLIEKVGYDEYFSHRGGEERGDHPRALYGMLRYMMSIEPDFAGPLFAKLETFVERDVFMTSHDDWDDEILRLHGGL